MKKATLLIAVLAIVSVSMPVFADIAAGTPLFTVTLPTEDTGTPPAPLPPWGSTGQNAMQYVKIFCDGSLYKQVSAPTIPVVPAQTTVKVQSAAGDFSPGTHACYATGKLYSLNESAPGNTVNFTIARPIYDPKPPALIVQ